MGMVNPWKKRQEGVRQGDFNASKQAAETERVVPVSLTDSSSIIAAESKKSGLSSARSRLFLDGGYKRHEPKSATSQTARSEKE